MQMARECDEKSNCSKDEKNVENWHGLGTQKKVPSSQ
jgi:hypothetical protein